jgi:hypothetical protein
MKVAGSRIGSPAAVHPAGPAEVSSRGRGYAQCSSSFRRSRLRPRLLRRMRTAAPANCVCQEKIARCDVFRETAGRVRTSRRMSAKKRATDRHPPVGATRCRTVAWKRTRSPRRKPGDSGWRYHPTCHADPGSPNKPVSPGFHPGLFVKTGARPKKAPGLEGRLRTSGRRPARRLATDRHPPVGATRCRVSLEAWIL